jgi:tol-pal system protein YbgF
MPRFRLAAITTLVAAFFAVAAAKAQSSDSGEVENRLLRLEEQIVDLSAQVGTLETIAKSGGVGQAAPAPGADPSLSAPPANFSGSDDDRITLMETQLRALSSQIGDMIERINRLEGGSGAPPQNLDGGTFREGALDAPPAGSDGFGAVIEGESSGGQQGGLDNFFNNSQDSSLPAPSSAAVQTAAQSTPQAQAIYDEAYNALVQRNYRAAAGGFRQFVDQFATDPLAGQAYFWLGEAAFVNGQYREAADSFLKSSTNYPENQKAPESLLKLGISLKRLDETQAACSSFDELQRRYPDATQVLERAQRERQRAEC